MTFYTITASNSGSVSNRWKSASQPRITLYDAPNCSNKPIL